MRKWENIKHVSLRKNCNWTDTPFSARHHFSGGVLIFKPWLCTVFPSIPRQSLSQKHWGTKEVVNDFLKVIYRIRVLKHSKMSSDQFKLGWRAPELTPQAQTRNSGGRKVPWLSGSGTGCAPTDHANPPTQTPAAIQVPGGPHAGLRPGAGTSPKQQGTFVSHLIRGYAAPLLPPSQTLPGAVQLSLTL